MSDPLPFEPDRFRTSVAHYRAGRAAYPPALIRRVATGLGLGETHRVLDLGCGPGPLAIGFAYFAGTVIGLDPEPRMLEAARAAAQGLVPNASFHLGSSYDLGTDLALGPGRFRLVTMGRSFHWMDRAETLRRLDPMIEPDGAVALFRDTHLELPENAWVKEWRVLADRYAAQDPFHARRRAGAWRDHEAVLLDSVFCRLERISVVTRHEVTTESLVERALSMSSLSRARLGEQVDALATDLRALFARLAPDGTLSEVLESSALIARRA
ncbi:MAG TPA: class I SAM-dependent methyltransferase [Acetobacteraceae bacterium]|nr:class I SAM-dependent methyltransferase [Acetobacteraceae bacterium]